MDDSNYMEWQQKSDNFVNLVSHLIYDLIELVVKHKESLTYKRILTKLRKEKLEEDF